MIKSISKYKSIISEYKVIKWEIEPNSYRFIAVLTFIDDTKLFIRDYLFNKNKRKYSYHWQEKDENIIVRWDNAPHWESISTFPFHKHVGNDILASTETTLEDILEYISIEINNKKK